MDDQIAANETAIRGKASSADLVNLAGQLTDGTAQRTAINTAIKQFMVDMKSLLGDLVYIKENHAGSAVFTDAGNVIQAIEGSGDVWATFSVITSLVRCSIDNSATTALQNSSYSATITLDENTELSSVLISMGGVDITSTAWNEQTGAITIPTVTGNIIIACSATLEDPGESDDPGDTPTMVETVLFENKAANGSSWSMKSVPVTFANGDYFEASINCANVDDSGSGTSVFSIGETGHIGYGSTSNSITVFWRSDKALCRYKTAGGSYTTETKDEWVTVSNKQFTVSLDASGFKVNNNLVIAASVMPQLMAFSVFELGSTSSSNTTAFYPYIKVCNLLSANDNVLYRNYTASGVFSTPNVSLNLSNGGYVETWIDCTGLESGTCIFTIGESGKTTGSSDINAISVIYNGSSNPYSIQYRVNGGNYTTVSMDTTTVKYNQVMLRLDSEGFKANGEALASVKIAAADMSQTMGITNWEIGSAATPASGARYARIRVHNAAA